MTNDNSYEVQKWTRILNHPHSTEAQKAEARQHLGMSEPSTPDSQPTRHYSPDLDEVVHSYWGVRKRELEERHPIAERIYLDLVLVNVCGGSIHMADNEAVASRLLPVLRACKSAWMKDQTTRALISLCHGGHAPLTNSTARVVIDALISELPSLPEDLKTKVEGVINAEAAR